MKINPATIAPSQHYLKPETVRYILKCFANQALDQLPPAPIVRQDEHGQYVAIDGHNLIAVSTYLGKPVEVHIAKNAKDILPENTPADKTRNQELHEKFDSSLVDRDRVGELGINSFQDLVASYPEIFSGSKISHD